jgi:diphthamide biosynthesis protein 3
MASELSSVASKDDDRTYDEVRISAMEFVEEEAMYYFTCPCGDLFEISQADLDAGERIARCPSCSLTLRVLTDAPEDAPTQ